MFYGFIFVQCEVRIKRIIKDINEIDSELKNFLISTFIPYCKPFMVNRLTGSIRIYGGSVT